MLASHCWPSIQIPIASSLPADRGTPTERRESERAGCLALEFGRPILRSNFGAAGLRRFRWKRWEPLVFHWPVAKHIGLFDSSTRPHLFDRFAGFCSGRGIAVDEFSFRVPPTPWTARQGCLCVSPEVRFSVCLGVSKNLSQHRSLGCPNRSAWVVRQ